MAYFNWWIYSNIGDGGSMMILGSCVEIYGNWMNWIHFYMAYGHSPNMSAFPRFLQVFAT